MEPKSVESIAVLGAGVMGHGIAQLAAQAGLKVALRDVDQKFLDIAKVSVEKSLARLVDRGRVKKEDAAKTLGRISFMLSLQDAVKDADVIIEAIPEVMGIKKRVWSEAFQFAKPTAIFASNTSSLSITEMSAVVSKPENFIGMHFFNPPQVMLLVEVIPGEKTSQDTIATVEALAKKLGKTPVTVKRDAPGFIVNRILVTYLNEAAKLLDQGFTKEQVDAGMQFNAGMPMGPFMLSDLIGIDIVHNIIKVFENNLGVAYKVAEPITKLFEQNKFGRKSGEGFYNYAEKPTVTEQDIKGFDPGALINSMISEAEKLVKDGVADIQSIDLAVKLGANVPWGPFELKKRMESGVGLMEKLIEVETKNSITKITINRPTKLNSLTTDMLKILGEEMIKADKERSVRCIIITGKGDRAFSAGADIDEISKLTQDEATKYSKTGQNTFLLIKNSAKPTVAAVNGFALGGGCELASWCDFRIASDKARFGQTEVNLGVMPGWGGTQMLAKLVGEQKAKILIMTGDIIGAEEAKSIGLVDIVYPDSEFSLKVDEFASKLSNLPPKVIAAIKRVTNPLPSDSGLEAEANEFSLLFGTNDFKEGVSAFKEKRKPAFKGE